MPHRAMWEPRPEPKFGPYFTSQVFVSKECSKSQPGNNSQGPKYMLKPTFGVGSVPAHTVESSARRAPNCVFGTDDRWSAQRREDIGRSLIRREATPLPMPMR